MRRGIVVLILACLSTPAFASHHRHHHRHHMRHHVHIRASDPVAAGLGVGLAHMLQHARPHDCYGIAWCGCWLRHALGVTSRQFNLAREWAHWGKSTTAHVGAVVVWRHHVGLISGGSPGNWIITSGNDGHAVRSRRRSIAGAIAFREG